MKAVIKLFRDLFGKKTPILARVRAAFLLVLPALTATLFILTLVKSDSQVIRYSFRICMSGLVGFYTNWIAIKMLFHPREPLALSGWQGLIPKNKGKLAVQIGEEVQGKLLSPEVIAEHVSDQRLFEKGSALLLRKVRAWADTTENRQRIRNAVGGFIQRAGKDNLDQFVEKTLKYISSFLQNRKNIQKLLGFARDTFEKVLCNEALRAKISTIIDRFSLSLLKDDGPVAGLIGNSISDLKEFLKKKKTRKSICDFLLTSVRSLKESQLDEISSLALKKLEKFLVSYRKTGKAIDAVSEWLSSILTKPGVVDYVASEVIKLLEKNSETFGRRFAEGFKNSGNWFERAAKKTFVADKWIVDGIGDLGRSDEFKATIYTKLAEIADISRLLKTSGARRKIIMYLSKNRKSIVEWCMKTGVPLLEKLIDSVIASEAFWDFLIKTIDRFSDELSALARKHLPMVMHYIRELLQRQHVGESMLDYFSRNESVVLEKLTAPETAEKLSSYIYENRNVLSEFIEERIRPLLAAEAEKLLSSESFWNWIDSQINRFIPMISVRLRQLVQGEAAKRKLAEILPGISSSIRINEIVERQVSKFSTDDLEQMVDSVSGENLAGIEIFGGLLGLAAGTITIVSEAWQPAAVVFGVFTLWLVAETVAKRIRRRDNAEPTGAKNA